VPKSVYTPTYRRFLHSLVQSREKAGVTQVELAKRIGWQQTDISKVERGERRLDVVEFLQFAKAMDLDAAEFIRQFQDSLS